MNICYLVCNLILFLANNKLLANFRQRCSLVGLRRVEASGCIDRSLVRSVQQLHQILAGGVAQLGERLLCKQEVIGSIPFTSTNFAAGEIGVVN